MENDVIEVADRQSSQLICLGLSGDAFRQAKPDAEVSIGQETVLEGALAGFCRTCHDSQVLNTPLVGDNPERLAMPGAVNVNGLESGHMAIQYHFHRRHVRQKDLLCNFVHSLRPR